MNALRGVRRNSTVLWTSFLSWREGLPASQLGIFPALSFFFLPVFPEQWRMAVPCGSPTCCGRGRSLSQLYMLQLCPSTSGTNDPNPHAGTVPEVGTVDLRNCSAQLLAAKQFLGEKMYFAEFMKLFIFHFLSSIWLDPEPNNQAGVAKKLYIHLSADCLQGHACLTSCAGPSSLHIFGSSP